MPRRLLSGVPLRTLVSRSADKKISSIVVLFQPDVNARTKSAGRKSVVTSDNPPREVIYPDEIWLRGRRKREREDTTSDIHTAGHFCRESKWASLYR